MIDTSKIKRRLGAPPAPEETKANLQEPETAPAVPWVDGRSLRATGRTSQLATRISPELHHKAKLLAARDRITMAELIEIGITLYAERHGDM